LFQQFHKYLVKHILGGMLAAEQGTGIEEQRTAMLLVEGLNLFSSKLSARKESHSKKRIFIAVPIQYIHTRGGQFCLLIWAEIPDSSAWTPLARLILAGGCHEPLPSRSRRLYRNHFCHRSHSVSHKFSNSRARGDCRAGSAHARTAFRADRNSFTRR
jgi:hypothetical protein